MNNTTEYWDIAGTSLHQYGWSVATVGGSRYDLPPRRGDNLTLPYRPGQRWRPKLPDARPITLVMWVTGMDPATGNAPVSGDQILRWNDSWDELRRLLWTVEARPFTLTRRTRLTRTVAPNIGQEELLVVDAQAELTGTMAPTMTGRTRADFSLDLLLPDPYFYGPQVTVTLNRNTAVPVYNPGHDVAAYNHFEIDLIGPLTNPRITNSATAPDTWVQYTGTVAAGQTLHLDVGQYIATRAPSVANLIGAITHAGARHWMGLQPKLNTLTLTAASGAGSAVLRYRPPYV